MPLRSPAPAYQEHVMGPLGALAVGVHTFGPFTLGDARGVRLEVEKALTSGTLAVKFQVNDFASGDQFDMLDDAATPAAVQINDFAAGETGHRLALVHPEAPSPATPADGPFARGNDNYYNMIFPTSDFYLVATVATGAVQASIGLHYLP